MTKLKNIFKTALFIFALYILLFHGNLLREGISNGLILCVSVVIPSLYTFIVFSTFIVNTNFFAMLKSTIPAAIPKIFKMNRSEFLAFFISLIGGYPSGAKLIYEMSESGEITKKRAAELLPFFISAGPAFIITGIGLSFYNSSIIGFILFTSHTLASLVLPIFMLRRGERSQATQLKRKNATDRFVMAISSCSSAIITMTGFIIFFGAVLNTAFHSLNLSTIGYSFLSLFFEITTGCRFVSSNLPVNTALLYLSAGLSFSSISILMQTKFLSGNLSVYLPKLLCVRLLHSAISVGITFLLLKVSYIPSEVFSNIGETSPVPSSLSVVSSLMFILLMFTTILKVEKKTSKKR